MKLPFLFGALLAASSALADLKPVWQIDGFKMPESVVYDEQRSQYYVSNINQGPLAVDNNGSIGLIDSNGKAHTLEWVSGLSSPKGLALKGDYLYAADTKELVVINVEEGKITARFPAPEAVVLNGLAFDKKGTLYVSDWAGNKIYKLEDNELKVWLSGKELESPNGLVVKGNHLYVASWGLNPGADFTTDTSGLLKKISLKTGKIENLREKGNDAWMNLDGLHPIDGGWLATDFMKGELLTLDDKGSIKSSEKLAPSAADFFLVEGQDLIVVPYLMANKVVAYKYEK
ncbi:YncE family protein [Sessilibacter corallicola]|uniref:YncE family protein n=1 Tax=Sessilibacter corallicola TaxID=2904075 RepID=UPI001E2AB1D7|nr:hypothetical protein [Sessilibacter corallicola]MCE2029427.1 hypothetical protein [Sessilibacter corallicola]